MKGFSGEEVVQDDIDLKEQCPEQRQKKCSLFILIDKDDMLKFQDLGLDFFQNTSCWDFSEKKSGDRRKKKQGQKQTRQSDEKGNPNNREPLGHVQAGKGNEKGKHEEDDDPCETLHDHDGRRFQERAGIPRPIPDANNISAESRWQEQVKKIAHEIGLCQEPKGNLITLGSDQELPPDGADK